MRHIKIYLIIFIFSLFQQISHSEMEIDVLWINGETGLDPSPTGSSSRFLNLFGLDTKTYMIDCWYQEVVQNF